MSHLNEYDWIALTSTNTVSFLAERLDALHLDARAFGSTRVAAIGPATALALKTQLGLRADYMPAEAVAEAMLAGWPAAELSGQRILLPRALEARDVLPDGLRERGATVDVAAAYQTRMDGAASDRLRTQLQNGEIDVLTFTASSTVRNFAQALSQGTGNREQETEKTGAETLAELVGRTTVASIGPVTSQTLRELGLTVDIEAPEHTIPGLVAAIETYFSAKPQ